MRPAQCRWKSSDQATVPPHVDMAQLGLGLGCKGSGLGCTGLGLGLGHGTARVRVRVHRVRVRPTLSVSLYQSASVVGACYGSGLVVGVATSFGIT